MNDELRKVNEKIVEMGYKSFRDACGNFKDFNKFDDFIENCLKKGKQKVMSENSTIDFEHFDINQSLWEICKKGIMKQMEPKDVKLNMAKMFAYNLENERVIASIKSDEFWYKHIKEELIKEEMFEDIKRLEKILDR